MILSAAVSAGKETIDKAYNVPEVSKYLDLINIMAYDFHGTWESFTHHHSPLFGSPLDIGTNNSYFNVVRELDFSISHN